MENIDNEVEQEPKDPLLGRVLESCREYQKKYEKELSEDELKDILADIEDEWVTGEDGLNLGMLYGHFNGDVPKNIRSILEEIEDE